MPIASASSQAQNWPPNNMILMGGDVSSITVFFPSRAAAPDIRQ
jgi:hypothetical protein